MGSAVVAVAVAATIERTSGGRSKASRRRVQNTMQIFAPLRDSSNAIYATYEL